MLAYTRQCDLWLSVALAVMAAPADAQWCEVKLTLTCGLLAQRLCSLLIRLSRAENNNIGLSRWSTLRLRAICTFGRPTHLKVRETGRLLE